MLWLFLIVMSFDALGIWALWSATGWTELTSAWLVALLVVARIVGIAGVLVVAPILAVFLLNIVMPVFNEAPFLAGVRALDPARAQALAQGPSLGIGPQIRISVLRLGLFLFLSLLSLAVSFVPVLGQIAGPSMGLYFSARALSWELLDPYFTLTNTPYEEQVRFLGRHHACVVGFGLPFALMFALPLVGPLVFVLAQASAATLVCEVLDPGETSASPTPAAS